MQMYITAGWNCEFSNESILNSEANITFLVCFFTFHFAFNLLFLQTLSVPTNLPTLEHVYFLFSTFDGRMETV